MAALFSATSYTEAMASAFREEASNTAPVAVNRRRPDPSSNRIRCSPLCFMRIFRPTRPRTASSTVPVEEMLTTLSPFTRAEL